MCVLNLFNLLILIVWFDTQIILIIFFFTKRCVQIIYNFDEKSFDNQKRENWKFRVICIWNAQQLILNEFIFEKLHWVFLINFDISIIWIVFNQKSKSYYHTFFSFEKSFETLEIQHYFWSKMMSIKKQTFAILTINSKICVQFLSCFAWNWQKN